MFNTTLMEPTAYRHFVQTGQFREGTMLALILQGIGTNATPARQGQFATDVHVDRDGGQGFQSRAGRLGVLRRSAAR